MSEAELARAAQQAADDQQYADLPDWVRPGALCDRISWTDSTAATSVEQVRVLKILKRHVVVVGRKLGGAEVLEHRHHRATLGSADGRQYSGADLVPLGTERAADLRAVAHIRHLARRVGNIVGSRYTSSPVSHNSPAQPLKTVADAFDVLREIEAACDAAHRRLTTFTLAPATDTPAPTP